MNVGTAGSSTAASATSSSGQLPFLHVRREPFEYGLLPLHNLMFPDATTTLRALRSKLLAHADDLRSNDLTESLSPEGSGFHSPGKGRVNIAVVAHSLDLSDDQAQLLLETLASILPDYGPERDPLCRAAATDIDLVGANIDDLLLFLYIQNYKKPPIRPHKDAASVADVWPSTSAFDGVLSALSPLQVRTSRRSMPSQADEEAHQLAYVQKHLPALLSLLVEPSDDEDTDSQVLTLEHFNHLGFLLRCGEISSEVVPLSQAAPFFANSDPDMPAVPVSLSQVLEWVLDHVYATSEHPQERYPPNENGPIDVETDVTMVDACGSIVGPSGNQGGASLNGSKQLRNWCPEGLTFVDGVTKSSVLKEESDINGGSVKVSNCHDSVVYILAPLKYASVYGCSDSIVVLGAVGKVVRIEHCERVQLIVTSVRVCIANCRECLFYMAANQRPLMLGENHKLQVAPYNTFYPRLESHLAQVGVDTLVNKWDKLLTLGVIDPHDSVSHAAGAADATAEAASLLPPDRYMNFVIPRWSDGDANHQSMTKANPFTLPKAYLIAQQQRSKSVEMLKQTLKTVPIDEGRKQDLSHAIHVHFREWLYASGNIRQFYEFQTGDRDSKNMD